MNTDQQAIIKRIRSKAEILRLDLRAQGNNAYRDVGEILSLLDLMERS